MFKIKKVSLRRPILTISTTLEMATYLDCLKMRKESVLFPVFKWLDVPPGVLKKTNAVRNF